VQGSLVPIDISLFVAGISRVIYAVSRAQDRVYLTGIFVHANEDGQRINVVGCDGVSLAVYKAPLANAGALGSFLLPLKAAEVIKRLFADKKSPAEIIVAEAGIQLRCEGVRLTSKLIDGIYPEYDRVIPRANDKRVTVSVAALSGAIKRACLVSGDLDKDTLQVVAKAGAIEVRIACTDGERAAEEIAADYDGELISVGFHGKILGKMLESIHTTDVAITLKDHVTAGVFMPTLDDSEIYILMPKKIAPHEQVRGGS
jgi:DNA polymerase III subunit beta